METKKIDQSQEIRQKNTDVEGKLDSLAKRHHDPNIDKTSANEKAKDALESRRISSDHISFKGMAEGNRMVAEAGVHEARGREYERRANDLESSIRTKKEPESKRSEVSSLRSKANEEYSKARKLKDDARREFSSGY